MKEKLYTVFTQSGEKELKTAEQLNQILHTDNFCFYTTGDTISQWQYNKDLDKWEYNKIF